MKHSAVNRFFALAMALCIVISAGAFPASAESLASYYSSAEFESQFTGAGVNQTLHRILLHLEIPATVLLPLCKIDVNIETAFCVLETVIIGQVPGVYLPGSA